MQLATIINTEYTDLNVWKFSAFTEKAVHQIF